MIAHDILIALFCKKRSMTLDPRVTVQITYKGENILNEISEPVNTKDIEGLITVLKFTQRKTNDCLTRLTKDTEVSTTEENSEVCEEENSDEDRVNAEEDELNDLSPKRAKLKI
ncbi:uncharacterized protein [Neodiprion pinetum]|uniref:Uncharacterized protein LOC124295302 n=1 Tax=Neodiprion lecontei TaxID=441921 RepID=A0ABM3GKK0_NEOLC|nr:uncharacterized protein LOC124222745 [Neodiprion pinetum]XP_046600794.1 uncharacterized protein LOC124295302 [Neodiprion lecontei]